MLQGALSTFFWLQILQISTMIFLSLILSLSLPLSLSLILILLQLQIVLICLFCHLIVCSLLRLISSLQL